MKKTKKIIGIKCDHDENDCIQTEPLPEQNLHCTLWPIYRPYQIYEVRPGEWLISGNPRLYDTVWRGEECKEVEFLNPIEKDGLLNDLLHIDINCHESIQFFIDRYGLLGVDMRRSTSLIAGQIPARSYGVWKETLEDFQMAVSEIQQTYKLFRAIDLVVTGKDSRGIYENEIKKRIHYKYDKDYVKQVLGFEVDEANFKLIAKAKLLGDLRKNLVTVRIWPQLNSIGGICEGYSGLCLLDYAWLQFHDRVIDSGLDGSGIPHKYRKCANEECGNRFIPSKTNKKYCSPECSQQANKIRIRRYLKKKEVMQQNNKTGPNH